MTVPPPLRLVTEDRGTGLHQRDDDELVELAAVGNREAFTELVGRYHAGVRRYCRHCLRDEGLADDLAQDVFLDLWRAAPRYRPGGQFRAYLFTLARNRVRNAGRQRARPAPPAAAAAGEGATPDQLDRVLAQERERRLGEELAALSTKLREAVELRFTAGLDYRAIAGILGCSEPTVRSRVFLAVAELRRRLGEETR